MNARKEIVFTKTIWVSLSLLLMVVACALMTCVLVLPSWDGISCSAGNVTVGLLAYCRWMGPGPVHIVPVWPYSERNWICTSAYAYFEDLPYDYRLSMVAECSAIACCLVTILLLSLATFVTHKLDVAFVLGMATASLTAGIFAVLGTFSYSSGKSQSEYFLVPPFGQCVTDRFVEHQLKVSWIGTAAISVLFTAAAFSAACAFRVQSLLEKNVPRTQLNGARR